MTYRIEWIKRWNSRSMSWAIKGCHRVLNRSGYYPLNDGNQIDYLLLKGTDPEIMQHRRTISQILKRQHPKIPIRFTKL